MDRQGQNFQAVVLPAFGEIEAKRILAQDDLFAIFLNKFPVSPGHILSVRYAN
jgi:diadenosine tetraphosphate (Ap4A) HIT family hydrolase